MISSDVSVTDKRTNRLQRRNQSIDSYHVKRTKTGSWEMSVSRRFCWFSSARHSLQGWCTSGDYIDGRKSHGRTREMEMPRTFHINQLSMDSLSVWTRPNLWEAMCATNSLYVWRHIFFMQPRWRISTAFRILARARNPPGSSGCWMYWMISNSVYWRIADFDHLN